MLWDTYPEELDHLTIKDAHQTLQGDSPEQIPFWVWLFENPDSPLPMPGKISLYHHDCLHLLLKRGFSRENEAYIVGFTMGKDPSAHKIHQWIYQLAARYLFPNPYRLRQVDLSEFKKGWSEGRKRCFSFYYPFRSDSINQRTLADIRLEINL